MTALSTACAPITGTESTPPDVPEDAPEEAPVDAPVEDLPSEDSAQDSGGPSPVQTLRLVDFDIAERPRLTWEGEPDRVSQDLLAPFHLDGTITHRSCEAWESGNLNFRPLACADLDDDGVVECVTGENFVVFEVTVEDGEVHVSPDPEIPPLASVPSYASLTANPLNPRMFACQSAITPFSLPDGTHGLWVLNFVNAMVDGLHGHVFLRDAQTGVWSATQQPFEQLNTLLGDADSSNSSLYPTRFRQDGQPEWTVYGSRGANVLLTVSASGMNSDGGLDLEIRPTFEWLRDAGGQPFDPLTHQLHTLYGILHHHDRLYLLGSGVRFETPELRPLPFVYERTATGDFQAMHTLGADLQPSLGDDFFEISDERIQATNPMGIRVIDDHTVTLTTNVNGFIEDAAGIRATTRVMTLGLDAPQPDAANLTKGSGIGFYDVRQGAFVPWGVVDLVPGLVCVAHSLDGRYDASTGPQGTLCYTPLEVVSGHASGVTFPVHEPTHIEGLTRVGTGTIETLDGAMGDALGLTSFVLPAPDGLRLVILNDGMNESLPGVRSARIEGDVMVVSARLAADSELSWPQSYTVTYQDGTTLTQAVRNSGSQGVQWTMRWTDLFIPKASAATTLEAVWSDGRTTTLDLTALSTSHHVWVP